MLSTNTDSTNASTEQSVAWRKSGGDTETKPIHMHTRIRIPSPKTLTGTSSTIYQLNSSSHPLSVCMSMHSLKRPWRRCTYRPLLTASESSNPWRYKLSYMEVWYSQRITLMIKCKCGKGSSSESVSNRALLQSPFPQKDHRSRNVKETAVTLSLLKPAYCINKYEAYSITS